MNRRELMLILVLVVLMMGGGGYFVFASGLLSGMSLSGNRKLEQAIEEKRDKVAELRKKQKEWEHFRNLSLPGGNKKSASEVYHTYLADLVKGRGDGAKFEPDYKVSNGTIVESVAASSSGQRGTKPPFTRVNYTVTARGTEEAIGKFLERFYRAPKLQEIVHIAIKRPPDKERGAAEKVAKRQLDFEATVEALIVEGSEDRRTLNPEWYQVTDKVIEELKNSETPENVVQKLQAAKSDPKPMVLDKFLRRLEGLLGEETLAKYKDKLLKASAYQLEPLEVVSYDRNYNDIRRKDMFYGPVPPQPQEKPFVGPKKPDGWADYAKFTKFVRLTAINEDKIKRPVAWLWDRGAPQVYDDPDQNPMQQLRIDASHTKEKFTVMDRNNGNNVLLTGVVCKIEDREIYFRIDPSNSSGEPKYYRMHMGQSLLEAMGDNNEKTIRSEDVKKLGLDGSEGASE